MSAFAQHYSEHGYAVARNVFEGDELARLTDDFDRAVEQLVRKGQSLDSRGAGRPTLPASVTLKAHNVHQYSGSWLRALVDDRLVNRFQEALGEDVILHHTKLLQKPAEKGAELPLHQDWPAFPTYNDSMCCALIHLSEARDEMGCLRVVPGTHKLGRVQIGDYDPSDTPFDWEKSVPVQAGPGDVVFFHYLVIHGSRANTSGQARKIVAVQAHAGDDDVELGVAYPNERLVLSGWNSGAFRHRVHM